MIITLTGPTCAGKTTIEAELASMGVGRAISHTTRAPRVNEINGVNYHFVSRAEFDKLDAAGEFIEKIVFGDCNYAMSAASLTIAAAQFEHTVIVVDPEGANQIHQHCRNSGIRSVAVWVDCEVGVQAKRWVERLVADVGVGRGVAGAYAERLRLMLTEEVQWRAIAAGNPYLYMMDVDTTQVTPHDAAKSILGYIGAM